MKLSKISSWPGTRVFRERRKAEKGTSRVVSPKKRSTSSNGIPASIHNNSETVTNVPSRHEIVSSEKEEAKISTKTNTGFLSKAGGERPCFLFEDNEDDNINDSNHSNNENKITDEYKAEHPQFTKLGNHAPTTPNANLKMSLITTPKNLFHPPQEIMIDPLAVPPSPMKEPNVNIMMSPSMNKRLLDDYHPGMYLSFQEPSSREATPNHHCFGDPVGDIAMQRQLMDAQRLVRIILGKQKELGASSILQAIRSYALMKAELIELRKKQEIIDGDPPAILQTLGSPAATTLSTTRTRAFSYRTPDLQIALNTSDSICGSTKHKSVHVVANPDAPITSALEEANETIERLRKELSTANDATRQLKEKMKGNEEGRDCWDTQKLINTIKDTEPSTENNNQEHNKLTFEESKEDHDKTERGKERRDGSNAAKLRDRDDENHSTRNDQHHDKLVVEETKQDGNLDLLLDEIVLIPQRVLTKDMVREKLELYYHTFTRHSSESQIVEMKKMRQSQEELDKRILEMENKMKLQDQEHKKQIYAIKTDKNHSLDSKSEKNKNTVLTELSHNTSSNTSRVPLSLSIRKPMVDNSIKIDTEQF